MKLLSVDSSAGACSAALTEQGKVLGEFYLNTRLTHSQTLLRMIDQMLNCAQTSLEEIDGFAVSAGPGSFTGVRIGVAAIKGMAMALGKPCAGVSTLEAMAENAAVVDGVLCAVMDARCGQVYNAMFSCQDGKISRLTEDRALPAQDVAAECKSFSQPVYLLGDGAEMCAQMEAFQAVGAILLPEPLRIQRASGVAKAGERVFAAGKQCSAAELLPIYLRMPQAERERKKKLGEAAASL